MTTETQTGTYGSSAADSVAQQPFLFVVVQGNALTAPALRLKLLGCEKVVVGRADARACSANQGSQGLVISVGLADDRISKAHCELRREARGFVLVDSGSKNGTRVNGERCSEVVLEDGALIELGRSFLLFRKHLAPANVSAITSVDAGTELPGCATLVPSLGKQWAEVRAIAPSTMPVLVRGETGTGKELAAAAVHTWSKRSGAFVPVNCGALPAALAASELFGYKKGAFSGALDDRPGLVRAADRGTLFLDEVAELMPDVQVALLRVLQEGEVLPLGSTRPVKVDVRIIAATHRDLEAMVASGEFRQDLFARLTGFTVRLPPLRSRREDLGLVLAGLVTRRLPHPSVSLKNASSRRLFAASFERNIRELEQALLTASALTPQHELDLTLSQLDVAGELLQKSHDADLKAKLEASLRLHGGNISAVANDFGKARTQIHRWIKRFGVAVTHEP